MSWKDVALAHAKEQDPKESCGLLIDIKGKEKFQLRIENKDFGLKKVRYWKHGNKMIYLVPLENGKVVTLYGNISITSALEIAKSLDR